MCPLPQPCCQICRRTTSRRIHIRRSFGCLSSVWHARECRQECESGDRSTFDSEVSEAGKASNSFACKEGAERFRCWYPPRRQKQKQTISPICKAWGQQRAWHRCAASAAEIERNRRCEGCWKTFCAPHLSLPKGLNLERGRGVEHVRKRQRKGESSTP